MFINPHSFSSTSFLENETTLRVLANQTVGGFIDPFTEVQVPNADLPFLFRSGELYISLPDTTIANQQSDWKTFQISEYISTFHAIVLCHGSLELITNPRQIDEIQTLFKEKFATLVDSSFHSTYALLFCKQIIGYMK